MILKLKCIKSFYVGNIETFTIDKDYFVDSVENETYIVLDNQGNRACFYGFKEIKIYFKIT